MKRTALISTGYSIFCGCIAAAILLNGLPVTGQPFKLGAVSEMDRVFEDGYKLPVMHDTLEIFGIRGEVISGQLALQSKSNLTNVTVSAGELKLESTGSILPAKAVEWNFVGSIPLSKNTPNQPARILVRQAPARYPDYLMAEKQISVKEKSCQAIWLTVSIPENAAAGTYSGTINVKSQQGERLMPFRVKVFPLTLPVTRHLKVTEWYNTDGFDHFHGIHEMYSQPWFAMLRIYAENMAAHRQNVFQVPMEAIEIQKSNKDQLTFDFTRFDQIAQVFWDTKKMDFLETGELTRFGEGAWSSTEILLRNFDVKNPETGKKESIAGKDVIPGLLPALESHLRQKGWLNNTLFHIKDEPSMHNSMAWRDMSSLIHHYAPDLKRMDAIETTNLLDYIEIAVPKLDAFATWYDTYRNALHNGTELWFYTVGIYQGSLYPNKTIDLPVMNSRILHWLNYKYDATGYLHWGWNQWEEDPYQDVGMHIGDGWHVYPVKEGVLNSLRWEEMRNGIQDYECFRMLENEIGTLKDSLGNRADWIDPEQRGKEIAGQVVMSLVEHSDDPVVLNKAKKELIREIIDFKTSPRLYIQTNPPENSTLTYHSSVEVYGWTEPGTKIILNGKELPVNAQGYFLEQVGGDLLDETKVSLTKGEIKVRAINANGSKEVVREFGIKF
jgi:hypothetical protein